jgi:putative PepSY-like beta-lactamase-inhibitor
MIAHDLKKLVGLLFTAVLGWSLLASAAYAQGKDTLVDQIPKKVMDALKGRFPMAEVHKWSKETEDDIVVYDIEFTQRQQPFEADIKEDGSFHNWEKEVAARDVPEAVRQAVHKKYPRSGLRQIMAITAVRDGKDALEGYEIVLHTADGKEIEVTVAPEGKIVEAP